MDCLLIAYCIKLIAVKNVTTKLPNSSPLNPIPGPPYLPKGTKSAASATTVPSPELARTLSLNPEFLSMV